MKRWRATLGLLAVLTMLLALLPAGIAGAAAFGKIAFCDRFGAAEQLGPFASGLELTHAFGSCKNIGMRPPSRCKRPLQNIDHPVLTENLAE